jgi:hypothetical protein
MLFCPAPEEIEFWNENKILKKLSTNFFFSYDIKGKLFVSVLC